MPAGGIDHLSNLGLGYFVGEHSTHPDAVLMYVQHDSGRILTRLVEESLKYVHDEFHWRVIVVEQQDSV